MPTLLSTVPPLEGHPVALQPLPALTERALVAPMPGAFLAVGLGEDLDAAFDDATETAWYEYGRSRLMPSIASIDAGQVTVAGQRPRSRDLAVAAATSALSAGALESGVAHAYALTDDAAYRRRRLNLTLTDPDLPLPGEGPLPCLGASLRDRLLQEADLADAGLAAGEQLESVEIRRLRDRFRPVATAHPGPSAASFAALLGDRIVTTGHPTGGAARRAAVDLLRAGPVDGQATALLEVVKMTARASGPLISVQRVRVAQRASLRLTFATEKDPDRTRLLGWLFAGTIPAA